METYYSFDSPRTSARLASEMINSNISSIVVIEKIVQVPVKKSQKRKRSIFVFPLSQYSKSIESTVMEPRLVIRKISVDQFDLNEDEVERDNFEKNEQSLPKTKLEISFPIVNIVNEIKHDNNNNWAANFKKRKQKSTVCNVQ